MNLFHPFPILLVILLLDLGKVNGGILKLFDKIYNYTDSTFTTKVLTTAEEIAKKMHKNADGEIWNKIEGVVADVDEIWYDHVEVTADKIADIPYNFADNLETIEEEAGKTFDENFRERANKYKTAFNDLKKSFAGTVGKNSEQIETVLGDVVNGLEAFADDLENTLEENIEEGFSTIGAVPDGSNNTSNDEVGKGFWDKFGAVVKNVQKSLDTNLGQALSSKVQGTARDLTKSIKEFGEDLNNTLLTNFGERLEKIAAVPEKKNVTTNFEDYFLDLVKLVTNSIGENVEKYEKAVEYATNPFNDKLNESFVKIGARFTPNVKSERQAKPDLTLLTTVIVGSGVVITILITATVLGVIWYRKRFTMLTKEEVDRFRLGNLTADSVGKRTFDCREFPAEFEISRSRFILLNLIGQGNFGLVYNASLFDRDGGGRTSVAVKIPQPGCSKGSFKSILSELKILCYVGHHPHVLEFVGAYIEEIGKGLVYIATQLCENGALQECLRKAHAQLLDGSAGRELLNFKPNLYELSRYAHEIAMGMEYISSRKIIHGDLSTRNILLDSNNVCKIGDFGLSRKLYEYQMLYEKHTDGVGIPWRWQALESLKRLEFSTKSDVWSYGITLWEIYSLGELPYSNLSFTNEFLEGLQNGIRMSAPVLATDAVYHEMTRCWDIDPQQRPTFIELSEFFASARNLEYTAVV